MVKSELIDVLCKKFPDLQSRDVELAVNCMIKQMVEALESGERIEIRDFGSFNLKIREPRIARNPKTGETVKLPLKSVVHFKPGKQLKERVNDSRDNYQIKG